MRPSYLHFAECLVGVDSVSVNTNVDTRVQIRANTSCRTFCPKVVVKLKNMQFPLIRDYFCNGADYERPLRPNRKKLHKYILRREGSQAVNAERRMML